MKKKPISRSAFFTARFLIIFTFCVAGAMLALLSYAVNSEPTALARQKSIAPEPAQQSVNGVPVLQAIPSQETDSPIESAPAVPLQESGQINLAALGIHPLPFPLLPKASANIGPDSAAMGTFSAYMQTTSDIVNQNTVAAFAALSTGWTPGETVAFSVNGGTPTNFTANSFGTGTPLVYLGITISTGSGFGYITIDAVGNTSGRRTGAVVQVAPTGPYLPGVAAAPHAENTFGTSPQILMFGTGYPVSSNITRYRNGVSQNTSSTTSSLGTFFIATAALTNNGNTSAVFSADTTALAGSMNGSSIEERSDAGGPQAGDQNTTRAFVDRAVLNSTTGGSFAVAGEGFNPGETVNITTCATGSVTADTNGAASFFVTAAPGAAAYNCVLTGATSARVGRASVLAHTNATNRRGLIVAPSSVSSGGTVTVLADKLPANDTANVYLDGVLQGTATSNSDGLATFSLTTPTSGFVHEVGWTNTNGTGDAQATVLLLINGAGPTPTPNPTPTPSAPPNPTPTVTPPPTICSFAEGMNDVTTLGNPKGWYEQNNSTLPAGSTSWFQGNTAVFTGLSQCEPYNSYIGANFNNTGGTTGSEIISNWLETPPITLQNGGLLTFWTRTVSAPAFPDRLQVRMSTNGNSSNVGSTPTSVGDFTTLLLDINPTYQTTTAGSYPNNWTRFTITLSGLGSPIKGRLAFRYFVENAGPNGMNAEYIGIDSVSYTCSGSTPTPTCGTTMTPGQSTPPPTPAGCAILYDQTNAPGTSATNSQDFETANDAFDNQTADDFIVPGGGTWTIQTVYASGAYFNGTGPMPFVNLYFYSDSGGFPGTSVGTYLNTPLLSDSGGSIQVVVPSGGIVLGPGIYWVSVQARMDFSVGGQWGWTDRTTVSNNPAAWQNPGGGFAAGCTTWGRRGATCGIDTVAPDQIFRLTGCPTEFDPVVISGSAGNCASPAPTATPPATPTPPTLPTVPNVLMTLTGLSSGTTLTDGSGNYSFGVFGGGSYTVTPSKGPLAPGSAEINSVDVLAILRHFLNLTLIPAGCRLTAADAATNGTINTQDILAVQRFFLGFTSGISSCGQYKFIPANRSYPAIANNQTGQNYSMYVIGDVAATFANRPQGVLPDLPEIKSDEF